MPDQFSRTKGWFIAQRPLTAIILERSCVHPKQFGRFLYDAARRFRRLGRPDVTQRLLARPGPRLVLTGSPKLPLVGAATVLV